MKKKSVHLVNITPKSMYCTPLGGCPAIYEAADDTYVIIGKLLRSKTELSELKKAISSDETVIKIPKGLLRDLNLKYSVNS